MATETLAYGIRPAGHRLPDATHLGRVRLQITDLDRSLEFYRDLLGLRVLSLDGAGAVLGPQDSGEALVELHAVPGTRPVPRRGRLGLYHFAILLPTRADLARFVKHLAARSAYAGMSDHFVSEAVYLQDPDNLGIEVYVDRPRSAWRHQDGELTMTTVPLDVRDLVADAGAAEWNGMPAGTMIGHVHLHVGDLDAGARFYHDGVGFDKVVWSYPGALFLSAGGYHHHLGTNVWARGAGPASADEAHLIDWEVVVPAKQDVDAIAANLERTGAAVERVGPAEIGARDPWGTRLRVVSASR